MGKQRGGEVEGSSPGQIIFVVLVLRSEEKVLMCKMSGAKMA